MLLTQASTGSDALYPRLLQSLLSDISLTLAVIVNKFLNIGISLEERRNSMIVPTFKNSSSFDPLNYRPIHVSPIPVVCKSFERIIVSHLMDYFGSNTLLCSKQFGYENDYPTSYQLFTAYNDITTQVDDGKTVDLVFLDYSKALMHGILEIRQYMPHYEVCLRVRSRRSLCSLEADF